MMPLGEVSPCFPLDRLASMKDMTTERLELVGADRARYFVPTAICAYLAILCVVLIITSAFLAHAQNAVAVAAAGVFGLMMTGGLGLLFWRAQRRDLQFVQVKTAADAPSNFAAVRCAATQAGWRIVREDPARRLDAETSATQMDGGERVAVQFRGNEVLVASICAPSVGFSLVGRRHCAENRELVRQSVLTPPRAPAV
jgi:hypothetical protein